MLQDSDRRGPNEPSYRAEGLQFVYWSDLGSEEGLEFRRSRPATMRDVEEWLWERGYHVRKNGKS